MSIKSAARRLIKAIGRELNLLVKTLTAFAWASQHISLSWVFTARGRKRTRLRLLSLVVVYPATYLLLVFYRKDGAVAIALHRVYTEAREQYLVAGLRRESTLFCLAMQEYPTEADFVEARLAAEVKLAVYNRVQASARRTMQLAISEVASTL